MMSRSDWIVQTYRCTSCRNVWKMGWSQAYCAAFHPFFIDECQECGAFMAPVGVNVPRKIERELQLGMSDDERESADRPRVSLSGLRADVWDKTNGHCGHCGRELHPFRDFHIDHLMPFSRGGSDDLANLAPSCNACNLSKGGKPLEEWQS